jgi:hypothetical protein
MGGSPSSPQLQRELANLSRSLYTLPHESSASPPGLPYHGPTTIRQLLTGVSTWRGPGAFRLPAGIWPHMRNSRSGTAVLLGLMPSERFPLLSDAQLLGLLCEGSPEPRPAIADALRYFRLDAIDPAARARQVALIFSEWRLGADIADTGRRGEPAGSSCRLPRFRAAMARLIAGVDDDLRPLPVIDPPGADPAGDLAGGPPAYPPDTIPAGGLGGGFVFLAGERNVPAYRPITRAAAVAPPAAAATPLVAAPLSAPAPPLVVAGAEPLAPASQQDPPRRGRARGCPRGRRGGHGHGSR